MAASAAATVLARLDQVRGWQEDFYRDLHRNPELATGLPYASTVTATDTDGNQVPVMHAWHGSVVTLFQPAEEVADGARGMVDDRLSELIPAPDVALAQHVLPFPAGQVGTRPGPVLSSADSMRITIHGPGRPRVDAAGRGRPGGAGRGHRDPPDVTARVADAFTSCFGDRAQRLPQQSASEDFSDIPNALGVPYTYWGIGGIDPDTYRAAERAGRVQQDIPVNHSPNFAPVVQPTLDTGTQALTAAALAWA